MTSSTWTPPGDTLPENPAAARLRRARGRRTTYRPAGDERLCASCERPIDPTTGVCGCNEKP